MSADPFKDARAMYEERDRLLAENERLREALDWIEAEPEDAAKVQARARAALAAPSTETDA